jgi:hypothetical protein
MSSKALFVTVILYSLVALSMGANGDPVVPAIVSSVRDGRPLWVAEDVAFAHNGDLKHDLFSGYTRQRFDRHRSANRTDCRVFAGAGPDGGFRSTRTINALAENSKSIITGNVVAAKQGFFGGNPGTLYAIEVHELLKSNDEISSKRVLLFIGQATISTPRGLICARQPGVTPLDPNDRVLFFSYEDPFDTNGEIYIVDPRTQLIIQKKSTLTIPTSLVNETAPDSFDQIVERVRRSVEKHSKVLR